MVRYRILKLNSEEPEQHGSWTIKKWAVGGKRRLPERGSSSAC